METLLGCGLAALCLVLGFIALICQKIYIDPKTGRKTAVEMSFLGKMKTNMRTNYPALLFVFMGPVLAALVFCTAPRQTVEAKEASHEPVQPSSATPAQPPSQQATRRWTISGQLSCKGPMPDWKKAKLSLRPPIPVLDLNEQGVFKVECDIPVGLSFEDMYDCIYIEHPEMDPRPLILSDELKSYEAQKESRLQAKLATGRIYGSIQLKRSGAAEECVPPTIPLPKEAE